MAEREKLLDTAQPDWADTGVIESHLKSAVDTLTPDVWDRLDLSVPQEPADKPAPIYRMYRRMRIAAAAFAACLCIVLAGGGISVYRNRQVDSVVGIDVNPSVQLSVNRRERILRAEPLNEDAEIILGDMDLTQVDLNIGVNALIGSMVRHGYLDDIDNAILVTVSNSDKEKAATVRREVVTEVASSLEEHRVGAVVYDQELEETEEVRALADRYGISIGKAYFLQELVDENGLSGEDLETFAGMNMEEIAREIAERSYRIRRNEGEEDRAEVMEVTVVGTTAPETAPESGEESTEASLPEESSSAEEQEESSAAGEASGETEPGTAGNPEESLSEKEIEESVGIGMTEAEETHAAESRLNVRIDNVDYDDGRLSVHFKSKVVWKSPSVSVEDQDGETYSAKIVDNDSESCEIEVYGLDGGLSCEFIIGGVGSRGENSYGTVRGYFDTPEIAEGAVSSSHHGKKNGGDDDGDDGDDDDDDDDIRSAGGNTGAGSGAGSNNASGTAGTGTADAAGGADAAGTGDASGTGDADAAKAAGGTDASGTAGAGTADAANSARAAGAGNAGGADTAASMDTADTAGMEAGAGSADKADTVDAVKADAGNDAAALGAAAGAGNTDTADTGDSAKADAGSADEGDTDAAGAGSGEGQDGGAENDAAAGNAGSV
ncbi:MAG: hypothetical protein K6E83_02455 [Clostridium sp.]|nr:hypothetical protein [Clostridium sp.]